MTKPYDEALNRVIRKACQWRQVVGPEAEHPKVVELVAAVDAYLAEARQGPWPMPEYVSEEICQAVEHRTDEPSTGES